MQLSQFSEVIFTPLEVVQVPFSQSSVSIFPSFVWTVIVPFCLLAVRKAAPAVEALG